MKYVFKYAYHILPLLIIFGIGFLSIFGWIICAVCACKKCSCCVCKVPKCKTPAAVLSLISYVVVALISFYSLVEQNKVFSGLADIECAVHVCGDADFGKAEKLTINILEAAEL